MTRGAYSTARGHMGLETLANGIKTSAEQEAAALTAQAKEEEQRLLREARDRVRQTKQQLQRDAETAAAQARTRAEIRSRLGATQRAQDARRTLIDAAYARFLETLAEDKERLYPHLFALAEHQLGSVSSVAVSPADAPLAKKLFHGSGAGSPRQIVVRTQPMQGGLIAESSDGTAQVDLRYETLLEFLKSKTLKAVSEQLFR